MRGLLARLARRPPGPDAYPEGPVRDLAAATPDPDAPLAGAGLLAVDLETTGLDPERDAVVAVGWVPVVDGAVLLGEARHRVVSPPPGTPVGDSATLHGLTDDDLAHAPPLADVLPELLAALRGRALLAHHAPVELGFLGRAVRTTYSCGLPATTVDTMRLQHRLLAGGHGEVPPGALRLDGCRRHFGLPRYRAHDALTDALATAELLLAQAAELARRRDRPLTLADLGAARQG